METHNPNCDGAHCRSKEGEVRTYPLGAGGNLILCLVCWAHENRYRFERGQETKRPEDWPQLNWNVASVYETALRTRRSRGWKEG